MELKLRRENMMEVNKKLLIVPYGIETVLGFLDDMQDITFNRTLWN